MRFSRAEREIFFPIVAPFTAKTTSPLIELLLLL